MNDEDPLETQEWVEAILSVLETQGADRAQYLLQRLSSKITETGGQLPYAINTPYRNTIPVANEARMPGDLFMERGIRSLIRWNAMAMVMRANLDDSTLGGHISSFQSSATLYDVGFNYFFRARNADHKGDLLYIQGHSAPGIYARSYLEGRLNEEQLDKFRQEVDGDGLSSYPHPWLMPEYWQFPTVSMGLGPLQAIYQAHVMKYLSQRGLSDAGDRKVWCFIGDGEMDEPESQGAIALAGRENLDNLIFVINCNLQRLDGPVRGNGKIIQELEGVFRGAGWNVIKVVWGRLWDQLLKKDKSGLLQQRMDEAVDGEYQNYKSHDGAYTREHFFGKYPELLKMVEDMTDEDIYRLNRGGHDPYKVFAAYAAATKHKGQPTVILAKTVKGYGLGLAGEAQNISHSVKKLDIEALKKFRDRFDIPLPDSELAKVPYYRPPADSAEMRYLRGRREALGGPLPSRNPEFDALEVPGLDSLEAVTKGTGKREISTTMAFVRILSSLIKDKHVGQRVVPIVPDEARTFGMEGMFRQLGIYSSVGQLYEPTDTGQVMYYRESKDGQVMEEGINEGGAFAAWLAAATSYTNNDCPLVPFYVFYSMFGFQRVGDLCWAAGDLQARGFLIGATSGRTTLNGEGLQHQDGHSHILAGTVPNCVTYDPTYAYELAVIIQHGLEEMYVKKLAKYYYITVMNENYAQPAMPSGCEEGIIKGLYRLQGNIKKTSKKAVQLLGSGTILREVIAAAELLKQEFDIDSDVWSATSFNELRREGLATARWNMLHPEEQPRISYVEQCLGGAQGPVIASTDYVKSYADQIREFVPAHYSVLGTDGFGRSDSRERLRHFFEVDRYFVVIAALSALVNENLLPSSVVSDAIKKFNINPEKPNPAVS
ncbi:pyruvate dehydrogenase (acetyl-transferring), homodimeric type [Pseudomonadales bacterium]|nr:pyruvate dehydrogenase (acetyl-transferring), homodimeric type [Pseudomonadales bacterium]MDB4151266.1 pyruvate dehydrogenase (acetyl-transferring), homodimeric type [Pseudomonadales bacterium]MDB9868370.1 pyruvate dehydrogenase (acetyl-transferring), homodimeric type [Pseudomonadales bacterium]MDB9916995.1 pyruvate dehydrogenase (acetyl-transferring), homodimeric type [Pseudomonadales bacterium]MDB9942825.1 pyruvate dehydrogenase (acetyl-transferring), homodimeric type [Pseudomonadales bact